MRQVILKKPFSGIKHMILELNNTSLTFHVGTCKGVLKGPYDAFIVEVAFSPLQAERSYTIFTLCMMILYIGYCFILWYISGPNVQLNASPVIMIKSPSSQK